MSCQSQQGGSCNMLDGSSRRNIFFNLNLFILIGGGIFVEYEWEKLSKKLPVGKLGGRYWEVQNTESSSFLDWCDVSIYYTNPSEIMLFSCWGKFKDSRNKVLVKPFMLEALKH